MPSSGDPPHSGIKPMSLVSPASAGGFFTWEAFKNAHPLLTGMRCMVFLFESANCACSPAQDSREAFSELLFQRSIKPESHRKRRRDGSS